MSGPKDAGTAAEWQTAEALAGWGGVTCGAGDGGRSG